ncbi:MULTISPECIES: cold-shock protein [Sphingobacterium]|uniref:cold-shock protein n=1 Tax=Sphingobacterium TaxID=28453 RepID=UPI001969D075|nr:MULTISPECIES: cold-shock protein [unclassified Sphingobacterium]
MAKSQLTFNKKERAKKQQQKKKEKQERREVNKSNNNKGKSLEEMFAYVDEFGNISDTPPTQVYKFKEEDLQRPVDNEDEFLYGKVSYYNETGNYGFIRDNESRETVYFNDKLAGMVLTLNQKVKYKYTRTKQGNQISEIELM